MTQPITALKNAHLGETIWIVGTGPSLRFLQARHFGPGPVVAVNRSINHVRNLGLPNVLYSMQKDGGDKSRCPNCGENCNNHINLPPPGVPLLLHNRESEHCFPDWRPRYMMDVEKDFGYHWFLFSAAVCACLAKMMGCAKMVYLCCDSMRGDMRTYIPYYGGTAILVERDQNYVQMPGQLTSLLEKLSMPAEFVYPED